MAGLRPLPSPGPRQKLPTRVSSMNLARELFLLSPRDCAGSIDEVVWVRLKKPACFSGLRGGLYGLAHFLNCCFNEQVFTDSRALASGRGPFPWPCLQ